MSNNPPIVTVHPRVCGEQDLAPIDQKLPVGSSPRVRGTALLPVPGTSRSRFIPACAGNRSSGLSQSSAITVHPRVCGEQLVPIVGRVGAAGSSPRVRGTAATSGRNLSLCRFIPACAGNRSETRTETVRCPVHPRVCGEQIKFSGDRRLNDGSSPRVRGTDQAVSPNCLSKRFIPACAGNSVGINHNDMMRPVHPRVCGEQRFRSRNYDHESVHPRVCGEQPP